MGRSEANTLFRCGMRCRNLTQQHGGRAPPCTSCSRNLVACMRWCGSSLMQWMLDCKVSPAACEPNCPFSFAEATTRHAARCTWPALCSTHCSLPKYHERARVATLRCVMSGNLTRDHAGPQHTRCQSSPCLPLLLASCQHTMQPQGQLRALDQPLCKLCNCTAARQTS